MAGISRKKYKLKNGKEVIKYTITYRDIMGRQHTSGNYNSIQEAKKHINDFEDITENLKNITLKQIFNEFFVKVRKKYADSTITNYETYYNKYFKAIENINYNKLNTLYLQRFFDDIEEKSPWIADLCLKLAKSATNYSINLGLININKFNKVEKIELPSADINHLTMKELTSILNKCKNNEKFKRYYAMLFLFIGSGLREGELIGLDKTDYDPNSLSIRINKQYTKGKLKHKPKTNSSNRTIYIFRMLAEVLNEHIKSLPKESKLLFPNKNNNYINVNNLRNRLWKPLLKECGINKRVRLHDLRGSYIDLVLSNKLSGKFAQSQAGHSKWETTFNVYAQNNEDMIEDAQLTLNEAFKKCEQNVSNKQKSKREKVISFTEAKARKRIKKEPYDS